MKNFINFKTGFIELKELLRNGLFLVSFLIFSQIIGCKSSNENENSRLKSDLKTSNKLSKKNKSQDIGAKISSNLIPEKAYEIRDYVRINGKPKLGYVGGRKFKNLEKRLPIFANNHLKIRYQEWDVNKKIQGKNRGTERLITASDGSDYYTYDHYKSFQKLKNK